MSLRWTDVSEIAMGLFDQHPDVDPQYVRFTDLHRWVCELEDFSDDPERSGRRSLKRFKRHGSKRLPTNRLGIAQ